MPRPVKRSFSRVCSRRHRRVYTRLWFEQTIAARDISSDEGYSESQKLEALKRINEIQHRVWHAYIESPGIRRRI